MDFGELRSDFLAFVPGENRQQNYPSTVAYIAAVLLARMGKLGLLKGRALTEGAQAAPDAAPLLAGSGQPCPECRALAYHKVAGCMQSSDCGQVGSCG